MKRFLIPLLAALALPTAVEANWFGKYGSQYEAGEACSKWELKESGGIRYNVYSGNGNPPVSCFWENGQYLGIDNETKKVRKRFKY
tara:strand:- start:608 stop:865 length:258 start_codon:yes stop_codon:yes gene_type:complete